MIEIIAEAGVNHNGSINLAHEMIEVVAEAKADIIKFQTFKTERLLLGTHRDFEYLKGLELPYDEFVALSRHCVDAGIEFLSTPGDPDSLKFLVEECGVKRIKVGSDDLTNIPLLKAAFASKLPVILSTGMATVMEIYDSLIASAPEGKPINWEQLTLLHCVSLYPCPDQDANLTAVVSMIKIFHACRIGYSDHTRGTLACLAAAALGAKVIEKHFRIMPECPDAEVSATFDDLKEMVVSIRRLEKMMGSGVKIPCEAEQASIIKFRKSPDGLRAG